MTSPAWTAIVSQDAFASDDLNDIVQSNAIFVHEAVRDYGVGLDALPRAAVLAFLAAIYDGEVRNGRFARFIVNTADYPHVVAGVSEALAAIGATRHRTLFDDTARATISTDAGGAHRAIEDAGAKAALERHARDFRDIAATEDIIGLAARWLRALPGLRAVSPEERAREHAALAAASRGRGEQARTAEPASKEEHDMRTLCARAGRTFRKHTGAGVETIEGRARYVHYLNTFEDDYLVAVYDAGKLRMFTNDEAQTLVAEMPASPPDDE